MRISLRTKLIISSLAVIVICGLAVILAGIHFIGNGIIGQAQDKVRVDLNSARHIYQNELEKVEELIRLTAVRFLMKNALLANDRQILQRELERIRRGESLDILTFVDKEGRVIVRARNLPVYGDSQADDEIVKRVLSGNRTVAATAIVPREELVKEGADLAEQAYMRFIATQKARHRPETEETSAMMIKAASPVLDADGGLLGVLYGGNLLNRNYKIVDEVKQTVYQGVKYKGKNIGTATIFQGDLRISTNVMGEDGKRAIGTRVSEEVYDRVLVQGRPWIYRAFVVNNWYKAAYEPIKDINGGIIGILYVGILEEKFVDMRRRAILAFLGITLAGMIVALIVSSFLAGGVLKPIKHLVFASRQLAEGNLEYQVKLESRDEIGQLGETFNLMASSLKERDEKLKEYTSRQIMKSERLATLGQLAAGVAHEVNNPLGAVLMYTHLALEDLQEGGVLRENLEKALAEASRCRDIVKGLLDFSRQTEPKIELADVNEILERTLAIVENQTVFQNVGIERAICTSLPRIPIDVGQMQQVFTNIVLNAAEAMEAEGELSVATRMSPDNEWIEIEFADTGCGIPPENREKIFDPFFTTKEVGRGTGLGLAVSHGIIARHKGSVEVRSELGRGTSFTIRLPLNQKES
jgi:two-component system NtrC family sensor kinase